MRYFVNGLMVVVPLVLILGIFRGEVSLDQYYQLSQKREELQAAVDSIQQRNEHLREEIKKLKKSSSYAKKVLRDKYHVMDEDEEIIFFAR